MKLRKLAVLAGTTAGVLALSSAPAFAQDCFLTHASANSHQGNSSQWGAFQLADVLAAPAPDGFGLQCAEQVDAVVAQVQYWYLSRSPAGMSMNSMRSGTRSERKIGRTNSSHVCGSPEPRLYNP